MVYDSVEISNEFGIHARPASLLVKLILKYKSNVTFIKDSTKADGRSIMSIMMLAAGKGDKIKIEVDGDDEQEALQKIIELINNKFNE